MSSLSEITKMKNDEKTFEKSHGALGTDQGRFVKHVTRTTWGIGVNYVEIYQPEACVHGVAIEAACGECQIALPNGIGRLIEDEP